MPLRATAILAAPVIALALAPAPTDASRAVNPYTPAEACANDFDGTWAGVSDNKRDLTAPNGEKWGEVHLMWNDTTNPATGGRDSFGNGGC